MPVIHDDGAGRLRKSRLKDEVTGPTGPVGPEGAVGPAGHTGQRGITGQPGVEGATGRAGMTGQRGETGVLGPEGSTGPEGRTGPRGETGVQGIMGETGLQGRTGAEGAVGPRGETGIQGTTGTEGPQGRTGPRGETGVQGVMGETGLQGRTGALGPQGPTGEEGKPGDQGPQGDTGPQGRTGPRGETGVQGPTGPTGRQGTTGPRGETGAQGPTGEQGPQGPTGLLGETLAYSITLLTGGRIRTNDEDARFDADGLWLKSAGDGSYRPEASLKFFTGTWTNKLTTASLGSYYNPFTTSEYTTLDSKPLAARDSVLLLEADAEASRTAQVQAIALNEDAGAQAGLVAIAGPTGSSLQLYGDKTLFTHSVLELMQPNFATGAPVTGRARLMMRTTGAGNAKEQLVAVFKTGAVQVIATEP